MANWFVSTAGWTAVTQWAATTAYSVGDIRRQTAPTGTGHRVFRCTTAGTSGGSEPAWNLTKGATTNDNTVVWTEISGNSTYNTTSFAAPHYWLQHAISSSWSAAGDTIYVDDDHAETQAAAVTMTSAGTVSSPQRIICITSTFTNPPVAGEITTSAVGVNVATTGNNILTLAGSFYCYGLQFKSGSGANSVRLDANNTSSGGQIYESCVLETGGTSGGALFLGSGSSNLNVCYLINTDLKLNSASSMINPRGSKILWRGGSLTGTVPNGMFGDNGFGDNHTVTELYGIDLNSAGTWTSKYLCNLTQMEGMSNGRVSFVNCKLASTLAGVATGTIGTGIYDARISLINSDSSTASYREEHYQRIGSMVQDTTNYRNSGASDGTTAKSWKVVTLATSTYLEPFVCPDIYQWVDTTGAKTVTVYIANTTATLQDADIYMEVEYMGSSATPVGTVGSTRVNILNTGTNLTTDGTSTWAGLVTPTLQIITKSITVNMKGWLRVRVSVVKASQTVYIDPLISVA